MISEQSKHLYTRAVQWAFIRGKLRWKPKEKIDWDTPKTDIKRPGRTYWKKEKPTV